jgi:hypothetical protein
MRTYLQLPKEAPWIASLSQVFLHTLKKQWIPEIDVATSRARSEWLLDQVDLRAWAHRLPEGGDFLVQGYGAQIMLLLFVFDGSSDLKAKYWDWFEEHVLTTIQEEDSDLYAWLINRAEELVSDAVDSSFEEELNDAS